MGTEITSLVNKLQLPGYHEVTYVPNESLRKNGIFFYRLEIGGLSETKSMILMH